MDTVQEVEAEIFREDQGEVIISKENRGVKAFNKIWQSEIMAPELLPYKGELVDGFKEMLKNQQTQLDKFRLQELENVEGDATDKIFTATIFEMDIDRIRFMVARYLRARIKKIEAQMHALEPDHHYLSPHESKFLKNMKALHEDYFERNILNRIGESESDINRAVRVIFEREKYLEKHCKPDLKKRVICLPTVDFRKGDLVFEADIICICSYEVISDEVKSGKVHLL
jgi:hypothetical protein